MSQRQAMVAGNWKMNGSREMAAGLVQAIVDNSADISAETVVCPPHIYVSIVQGLLANSSIKLGAQNVSQREDGAFTGEVSAAMLEDMQCEYAIIGHSERRTLYNEGNELVAKKFATLLKQGIKPILCVGETLDQRQAEETESIVAEQLDAVIELNGIDAFANAVIAYEPVWAIGTGMTASPEQAQAVHAFIRERLAEKNASVAEACRILYGGSVKPDNAEELFNMTDIDGGLIGGASLVADNFLSICRATR